MATRTRKTQITSKKADKQASRKLKVFAATMGFYDTIVAAPSQAAALRAWGTRQNIFKDGTARQTDDETMTQLALVQPGVVLRRPVGTNKPFGLDAGVPHIPDLPRSRRPAKPTAKKAAPKKVDRSALNRAEAELSRLEDRRRSERDKFDARRRKLEAEEADAASRFEEVQARAQERIERARRAYVDAGGKEA